MMSVVPYAEGAAVLLPLQMHTHGKVPSEEMIRRIVSRLVPTHQMRCVAACCSVLQCVAHLRQGAGRGDDASYCVATRS